MKDVNVRFYLRASKKTKKGESPIYCDVQVDLRKAFSTKINIPPSSWDSEKTKVRGSSPLAKTFNRKLEDIKSDIIRHYMELKSKGKRFGTTELIQSYQGKDTNKRRTWIECLSKVVQNKEEEHAVGALDKTTLNKYKSSKRYLESFIQEKYDKKDLSIDELVPANLDDFQRYLSGKLAISTMNKTIQHAKISINYALSRGWIERDVFAGYKYKKIPIVVEFLLPEEVEQIRELAFNNERLMKTRDLLLFQVSTGLSYIDFKNLKDTQIMHSDEGIYILMHYRKKLKERTTMPFVVPLVKEALKIMEKYKDDPCHAEGRVLPVLSNDKLNDYYNELALLAGITRIKLKTHTARKTFGVIALDNDIPMEVVSHVLGHKDIRTTQRMYAQVLQRSVIKKVTEKIDNKEGNQNSSPHP